MATERANFTDFTNSSEIYENSYNDIFFAVVIRKMRFTTKGSCKLCVDAGGED